MKIDRFREWLEYIHDGRGKYTLPDSYGRSRVAGFTGYMTYQFVLQFAQNMAWRRCRSAQALKEYMDRHFLTDKIIKLENAKTQLLTVLEEVGYDLSPAQRETYDSLFSKRQIRPSICLTGTITTRKQLRWSGKKTKSLSSVSATNFRVFPSPPALNTSGR